VLEKEDESFYTREITIPFLLTVVRAMSFRNIDVLHSSQSKKLIKTSVALAERGSVTDMMLNPRISACENTSLMENMFLLTFDIHNEWDEPFKVTFDIYNVENEITPSDSSTTIIHPGVTKRIILPLSRIEISKSQAKKAIPTVPGKQFVISAGQQYPEGLTRAFFWYKEELVGGLERRGRLVMRWVCSNHRNGFLAFRSFEMTPSLLSIIKTDPIQISGRFVLGEHVDEITKHHYKCQTNNLCTLEWTIKNWSGFIR
jgi:hypothetical protein